MKTQYLEEKEAPYLEKIIAQHPFWEGLNPHFFHALFQCASFTPVAADQFIFKEGEEADFFYLIHKGHVAVETFVPAKGNVVLQVLGPGEALGWSWLFPPYRWRFSARTLEPVELVAFGAVGLREHAEENRDFGHELLTRVSRIVLERLRVTRQKLIEFYGPME